MIMKYLPGAGLEPARTQGPRDFKSLVSTKFHHPGDTAVILEKDYRRRADSNR